MLCISIYLMCNVILNCDFLFLDDQINIFYKKKKKKKKCTIFCQPSRGFNIQLVEVHEMANITGPLVTVFVSNRPAF